VFRRETPQRRDLLLHAEGIEYEHAHGALLSTFLPYPCHGQIGCDRPIAFGVVIGHPCCPHNAARARHLRGPLYFETTARKARPYLVTLSAAPDSRSLFKQGGGTQMGPGSQKSSSM
jgi:hypothetical protein